MHAHVSIPRIESTMEEESTPLPDELITEILVRLPVKSLVRFKIVSKSWYALIRSPNFVNQHTKQDRKKTMLLLSRTKKDDVVLSLRDPDSSDFCRLSPKFLVPFKESTDDYLDIVGPCNGLFFLSNESKPMLCNPALQEFKVLPPRPNYLCNCDVYNFGYGFGFDPLTGSYKVINIYTIMGGFPKVELYDSRSNCWRMIDSTYEMLSYVFGSFGIFFKGACHWETRYEYSSQPVVLSFDVSTEVFRHFEFPKWDDVYPNYHLSILSDRLTLVCYPQCSHFPSSISVDVWVMEEYGVKESWAQTFKIELNSFVREIFFHWEWILVVEDDNGGPKCLDLRNYELGRAFRLREQRFVWNAIVFKESLISLDDVICNAQDEQVSLVISLVSTFSVI